MNTNDPFADKLRRQDLRSIPPEWKKSILPATPTPEVDSNWPQFWASLLYPHRFAYASLALLWLIIALLRSDTPVSAPREEWVASRPLSESETLARWQEKQRYLMAARSNPAALEYLIR